MLFENTFQQKRTPPSSNPLIRPPVRSKQNTAAGHTVQKCKCGGANPSPVPPPALPAAGKNPVTGWRVHKKKKKHHPYAGMPAAVQANRSVQPEKRRTVPSSGISAPNSLPAGKKYIFTSSASEAIPVVNAVPQQRVQEPATNSYEPQPAVEVVTYPASPTPVYQPEPVVANNVKQPAYKCDNCGSKGGSCTTLSYFDADSTQLTEAHLQKLTKLAGFILENGIRFVTITGHTDAQDSDDNTTLGNDRSVAVNRALRKALHKRKPWSQTAIFWKVKTKGESQPVSNADAGLNRRVVVCLG